MNGSVDIEVIFPSVIDWLSWVIEPILIIAISLGNLLVVLVIAKYDKIQKPCDILVATLACSDLLIGIFVLPFDLVNTIMQKKFKQESPCFLHPFVWTMPLTWSVLNLFLISLEKYISLVHPLKHYKYLNKRRSLYLGHFSFLLSIILGILPMICRGNWDSEVSCNFKPSTVTMIINVTLLSIICATVIIYWRIFLNVTKPIIIPLGSIVLTTRRPNIKKVKMMLLIFMGFILFWTPLSLYMCYAAVYTQVPYADGTKLFFLLGASNSIFNWIVYLITRKEYRERAKYILKKIFKSHIMCY